MLFSNLKEDSPLRCMISFSRSERIICFYNRFLNTRSDYLPAICLAYWRERTSLTNTHHHEKSNILRCPEDYESILYRFYGLIRHESRGIELCIDVNNVQHCLLFNLHQVECHITVENNIGWRYQDSKALCRIAEHSESFTGLGDLFQQLSSGFFNLVRSCMILNFVQFPGTRMLQVTMQPDNFRISK